MLGIVAALWMLSSMALAASYHRRAIRMTAGAAGIVCAVAGLTLAVITPALHLSAGAWVGLRLVGLASLALSSFAALEGTTLLAHSVHPTERPPMPDPMDYRPPPTEEVDMPTIVDPEHVAQEIRRFTERRAH